MITDDDVMRLFERADPARTTDDLDDTPDATGYLAALRQRSNNVTYIQPADNPADEPGRHRLTLIAIAAAAVVSIVVGALALAARSDDEGLEVPATVPPTTPSPATTVPSAKTSPTAPAVPAVDDPIGQAAGFLAAFSTGDPSAVAAHRAEDFEMNYHWPRESFGDVLGEAEWLGLSYQVGSGAIYVDPTCTLVEEVEGVAVVWCVTVMELGIHQFTNTEGVGASVRLRVSDDGVVAMESAYATGFGFDVLRPFDQWREANRPGALPHDNDLRTAAESLEFARTEVELLAEWVDWATTTVVGVFADHNSGDLDAFLTNFDQSTEILGIAAPDAREVLAALMVGDQTYETASCEPDGIDRGLAIVCDLVVRPPAHEVSNVELTGTVRMVVTAEGTILSDAYNVDTQPSDDFNNAFEQWLLSAHPDEHGQVIWVEVGASRIASADDQALVAPFYVEFVAQSDVYPVGG